MKYGVGTLPIFVRMQGRRCIVLGEGPGADAKRRLVARAGAMVVGEAADAALAVVAIEDESAAVDAVSRLRARGILVNAVDRPELCDWTMPAIVDRSPVLVAIGTDGRSAGLAKALRQRLEALLPAGLGTLADDLFGARPALALRHPDPGDRRRAIDTALARGGPLDPLIGGAPSFDWIDGVSPGSGGRIEVIRLASRDPDDLTLAQARLLGQADCIVHRADVPGAILDRARADAVRIAGDRPATMPTDGLTIDIGMLP